MWRLLRQKYRVFVEQGVKPYLDSLMTSCTQLKANLSKPQVMSSPVFGAGPGGGGTVVNISSVLRLQMRNYSKKADATTTNTTPSASDDNCGAPKECDTEKKEGAKTCGPAHFKGSICDMVKGKKAKKEEATEEAKPKKKKKAGKVKSMWEIPGCEYDPLCDLPVRMDIAHYRITDKQAREYQVTWNECPRLVIKPKKVCIHQKHPRPKPCRRKRKGQTAAATARPKPQMVNPMKCKEPEAAGSCPRWQLPCCKPGRFPPSCALTRRVTKCKKRPAPYPSFSECQKDELPEAPPTECFCLTQPMACEVWAEVRRRIARGKSPTIKCGEV